MGSSLQSSLGNLERGALVPQGLLQGLDVLLLVIDLLHGLTQVGLQLVVRVGRLLRQITFDGQSFCESV